MTVADDLATLLSVAESLDAERMVGSASDIREAVACVERIDEAIDMCQVLCATCHKQKHGTNGTVPVEQMPLFRGHGTWNYAWNGRTQ